MLIESNYNPALFSKKKDSDNHNAKQVVSLQNTINQLCIARTVISILVTVRLYTVMPEVCRWLTNEKQRKNDTHKSWRDYRPLNQNWSGRAMNKHDFVYKTKFW